MDPVDQLEQLGSFPGAGIHPVQHLPPAKGDERERHGRHQQGPADADEQHQDRGQETPRPSRANLVDSIMPVTLGAMGVSTNRYTSDVVVMSASAIPAPQATTTARARLKTGHPRHDGQGQPAGDERHDGRGPQPGPPDQ